MLSLTGVTPVVALNQYEVALFNECLVPVTRLMEKATLKYSTETEALFMAAQEQALNFIDIFNKAVYFSCIRISVFFISDLAPSLLF